MDEGLKKNWTVKEVADYLGMKTQTIYNMVHTKKIPFHKVGIKGVRFKKDEIDYWIESRGKKATSTDQYILIDGHPRLNVIKPRRGEFFTEKEAATNAFRYYDSERFRDLGCETPIKRFRNPEQEIETIIKNRIVIPGAFVKNRELFTHADLYHIVHLMEIAEAADGVPGLRSSLWWESEIIGDQHGKLYDRSLDFYQALSEAVLKNLNDFSFEPENTMTDAERLYHKKNLSRSFISSLKEMGLCFSGYCNHKKHPVSGYGIKSDDFSLFLKQLISGYIYYGCNEYVEAYLDGMPDALIVKKRNINELSPEQIKNAISDKFFDAEEIPGVLEANIKELENRVSELKKIAKSLKKEK